MPRKRLTIGVLAHVDAGKTTLSEHILYTCGAIRKLGRVDHGSAFLDTHEIEQERGITIFSKEARFELNDTEFNLIDTPGHADFGTEAERALWVLDYAVLLISASEGVQEHTHTIWKLLEAYGVPTFVFINKMDLVSADKEKALAELRACFGERFTDMEKENSPSNEETALCSEELLEEYTESGVISCESFCSAVRERRVFPVYSGAALKGKGVSELLDGICKYSAQPEYPAEFGARVYKITRDKQGARQTHMKITGGAIKSKMMLAGDGWEEKAEQLRVYSGARFQTEQELTAGAVCAVTGLSRAKAGEGLGFEGSLTGFALEAKHTCRVILPQGAEPMTVFRRLCELGEENPALRLTWHEAAKGITAEIMGPLELEILRRTIEERFGLSVSFEEGTYPDVWEDELPECDEPSEEEEYADEPLDETEAFRGTEKELEAIFRRTYGESKRDEAIRRANFSRMSHKAASGGKGGKSGAAASADFPKLIRKDEKKGEPYLIVDGYNVVFAWEELAALAKVNIDSAREALIDVLKNYQGYRRMRITVVFDGYRRRENTGSAYDCGNVEVVYTKEAETADKYIERLVYEKRRGFDITVVTSDKSVQMAALGDGALRISSREFYGEVMQTSEEIRRRLQSQKSFKNRPFEGEFGEN